MSDNHPNNTYTQPQFIPNFEFNQQSNLQSEGSISNYLFPNNRMESGSLTTPEQNLFSPYYNHTQIPTHGDRNILPPMPFTVNPMVPFNQNPYATDLPQSQTQMPIPREFINTIDRKQNLERTDLNYQDNSQINQPPLHIPTHNANNVRNNNNNNNPPPTHDNRPKNNSQIDYNNNNMPNLSHQQHRGMAGPHNFSDKTSSFQVFSQNDPKSDSLPKHRDIETETLSSSSDPVSNNNNNNNNNNNPNINLNNPNNNSGANNVNNNNANNNANNGNSENGNGNYNSIVPFQESNQHYCDITEFLNMPQIEAAKKLQIPPSTLSKRWKEAARNRKWPWRTVRKIDKEITTLLHNVPPGASIPEDIEANLACLLKKRQEELKPTVIRL